MPRRWVPRLVLGAVAVIVLAIIVSISVGEGGPQKVTISGGEYVQQLVAGIPQDGAYLGSSDAPVTITVFNDLQAPSGAEYELDVVDNLIEQYARPGDARLEFRHYSFGAKNTNLAAFAAVAAGEQDREWQYVELFFRNQSNAPGGVVSEEFLADIAGSVPELDTDQWSSDLDSSQVSDQVEADAQLGTSMHLPAKPAVVVAGPTGQTEELDDAPSLDAIRAAVASVE